MQRHSEDPGTVVNSSTEPRSTPVEWLDDDIPSVEEGRARKGKGKKQRDPKSFIAQLPTFREFVQNEWKDLVLMTIVVVVTWTIPAVGLKQRLFPVPFVESTIANASGGSNFTEGYTPDVNNLLMNAYPNRDQIIAVWLSALLALLPSIIVFSLFQIKLRSYADLHAAAYGAITTLVHGTVFQTALKSFVGGLRPYFYDACRPRADLTPGSGRGFGGVMYNYEVCTGEWKEVRKALTGWPSGHSNAAMGSMLFLALYLNAKLKIFSDTRGHYWKMFFFFLPIIFGMVLCGSLTLDQTHTWYDILTGATIGMLCALASYRLRYASIWDFRFNHIPLPRSYSSHKSTEEASIGENGIDADRNPKAGLRRRGFRFGRRGNHARAVKRSQRFTYDLPTILAQEQTLPFNARHPHPQFPVMSRGWQGSAVGAPGDASWQGPAGVAGVMGWSHSAHEYGRAASPAVQSRYSSPSNGQVETTNPPSHVKPQRVRGGYAGEGTSAPPKSNLDDPERIRQIRERMAVEHPEMLEPANPGHQPQQSQSWFGWLGPKGRVGHAGAPANRHGSGHQQIAPNS